MGADIFGREKRGENEGFTKGAGTLERDNRTLYVNYEGAGCYDLPKVCVCVCEVVWERVTVQRDATTWERCSWISVKQDGKFAKEMQERAEKIWVPMPEALSYQQRVKRDPIINVAVFPQPRRSGSLLRTTLACGGPSNGCTWCPSRHWPLLSECLKQPTN